MRAPGRCPSPQFVDRQSLEVVHVRYDSYHIIVKRVEIFVFQIFAVNKIPLATGILVAPAVALAGKSIHSMSELVTHKVEIAAVDGRSRHEAYHLVESHAAGHDHIVVIDHHVPVHLLVNEAEYDSLVAHQSLVVTLDI